MKIVETDAAIARSINEILEEHFLETQQLSKSAIEQALRDIVISAIKREPEYHSLLSGRLLGEFGLTEPTTKLDIILKEWANQIEVSFTKKVMKIQAIYVDLSDVLSLEAATQITNKGETLNWLDWLLTKGDKTIIKEYHIEMALGRKSRSGLAVMVKEKRGKWKVPSQYSGTPSKNWLTRALNSISENKIEEIVSKEIMKQW